MNNRANEYSLLICEIINDDARLRAQGLPGLGVDEINQLRMMVQAAVERIEGKITKRASWS